MIYRRIHLYLSKNKNELEIEFEIDLNLKWTLTKLEQPSVLSCYSVSQSVSDVAFCVDSENVLKIVTMYKVKGIIYFYKHSFTFIST